MANVMTGSNPPNKQGMGSAKAMPSNNNPQATTAHDMRDKGGSAPPVHVTRLPPPVRPGRGLHDKSKMGG